MHRQRFYELPDLDYTMKFSHCLYKYVSITTSPDKRVYEGWLKTIDPVTGNSILVTLKDDEFSEVDNVILIMRRDIEDVKVLKEEVPEIKSMLQNLYAADKSPLATVVASRKEFLVNLIKKHRLPLREHEDGKSLVVIESVTINPPFIAGSCNGSNLRVLTKIRELVDQMPTPASLSALLKDDTGEKSDVKVLKEEVPEIKSMLQNIYAADKSPLAPDVASRKEFLVDWIKKHRLPLREHEDGKSLVVMELVTINPPFIAGSCNGSNFRVLTKIRELVDQMPTPASSSATLKDDTAEKEEEKAASD